MTVELLRDVRTGRSYARFIVEGHWDDRAVSVVGPFNDWTPGIDVLRPDRNGTRSALVEIPEGSDVQFRYLATGNDWFDDPDADAVTEHGSTMYWSPGAAAAKQTAGPAGKKATTTAKKAAPAKKPTPAKKVTEAAKKVTAAAAKKAPGAKKAIKKAPAGE